MMLPTSYSFRNHIYLINIYICIKDLALNNPQVMICHKTQPNKTIYWSIGIMVRVFTNGPGDRGSILGLVIPKPQKKVLDASLLLCLTLSNIRYGSRVKWNNTGKGVAPSPTLWCNSFEKGTFELPLLIYIYIYIYIYIIYIYIGR